MSEPTQSQLAQSAQASYSMSKKGSVQERLTHAQNNAPENYTVVPEHTNIDMTTFRHNTEPKYIISHRGTDMAGNSKIKDLKADLNILVGNANGDKIHKKRANKTASIIKSIKQEDPDHKIYMSSHSLGGSTMSHALMTKKSVRDNVESAHSFATGSSPLQDSYKPESKAFKEVSSKLTHHINEGDEISNNNTDSLIGKVKKYKSSRKPSLTSAMFNLVKPLIDKSGKYGKIASYVGEKFIDTLGSHSITHFIKK
jgi:hypothetical protein